MRWPAVVWGALLALTSIQPATAQDAPHGASRDAAHEVTSPDPAPADTGDAAQDDAAQDDAAPYSPWPIVAAFIPGVLLHGAGHWVAGERKTGYRLLAAEGTGLALVLAGGTTLFLTGAARDLVGPAAVVTIAGVGLFFASWFADLYGVIVPRDLRGVPRVQLPRVEIELGPRYVYDPQYDYRLLMGAQADVRLARWRLTGRADVAVDDDNQRLRVEAAYRLVGPIASHTARTRDGSFLEGEVAFTRHRYGPQDFTASTPELSVLGRLDLGAVDPVLTGSFTELGVGWALRFTHYRVADLRVPDDASSLLLMRLGFGVYLGQGDGEAMIYYDHRHDDYAAGMILPGLGSGVAGHVGISGFYYVTRHWGLGVDLQRGAAYIAGIHARYRLPEGT